MLNILNRLIKNMALWENSFLFYLSRLCFWKDISRMCRLLLYRQQDVKRQKKIMMLGKIQKRKKLSSRFFLFSFFHTFPIFVATCRFMSYEYFLPNQKSVFVSHKCHIPTPAMPSQQKRFCWCLKIRMGTIMPFID